MKYRAEIDGLRALAVVPVIFYHAGFELFSGGFVGVDVFFVISGYLITTIISEDIENNRFSIVNFYERRARRIFPALFFIVALTAIFSFYFLPPHALKDVGQSIFAVSLFISNIFFYIETDYFANTAEMAPLLHTWSLGVEEQFYIVFPFLLLLLRGTKNFVRVLVILFLLLVSFYASVWILESNQSFSFFMMVTRFWELALGSILAISKPNFNKTIPHLWNEIVSSIGIFLIFFAVFVYNGETVFPGFNALLPTIGTALIIMFTTEKTIVGSLISMRPLVWVGLLSYSLYLSHNAVFSLSNNIGVSMDGFFIQTTLIAVSIVVALVSFFFVEKPLRFVKANAISYLISSLAACVIFASFGLFLHKTNGLKEYKLNNISANLRLDVVDTNLERLKLKKIWSNKTMLANEPFSAHGSKKKILILGDSKSDDLYASLSMMGDNRLYEYRQTRLDDPDMNRVPEGHLKQTKVSEVVKGFLFNDADEIVLTATWQSHTNENVSEFILFLLENEKKVTVVSTSNFNDIASLSYVAAKRAISGSDLEDFLYNNIRQDWRKQFLDLKKRVKSETNDVRFLDKLDAFCDFDEDTCRLKNDNGWFMYDSGHLTVEGLKYFGQFVTDNWFQQ